MCRARKLPFSGHITKKFRRHTILQLNIEGLTASKMTVLQHLSEQLEALVILLQGTHCTSAEKLVIRNYELAGSSLNRKHGLAMFVHKRLKWAFLSLSPPTSETEWLCVDVDGYKIVNVVIDIDNMLSGLRELVIEEISSISIILHRYCFFYST